jgi:hypothetical protein
MGDVDMGVVDHALVAGGLLFGVFGHILKKVIQVRQTDASFHLTTFLTMYPYKSIMTLFYAVGGVAGLYWSGSAEFYTALTVGFAANSLSGASDK